MKILVLFAFFGLIYSVCIENGYQSLSCYSEVYFSEPRPHVEILYLYDSILTQEKAKFIFPDLESVFVYGTYEEFTCHELSGLYKLFGCTQFATSEWQSTDLSTSSDSTSISTPDTLTSIEPDTSSQIFPEDVSFYSTPDHTLPEEFTTLESLSSSRSHHSTDQTSQSVPTTSDQALSTPLSTPKPVTTSPPKASTFNTTSIIIICVFGSLNILVVVFALVLFKRRSQSHQLINTSSMLSSDSNSSNELENTPAIRPSALRVPQPTPQPSASQPVIHPSQSRVQETVVKPPKSSNSQPVQPSAPHMSQQTPPSNFIQMEPIEPAAAIKQQQHGIAQPQPINHSTPTKQNSGTDVTSHITTEGAVGGQAEEETNDVMNDTPKTNETVLSNSSDVILVDREPWAGIDETTEADISTEAQRGDSIEREEESTRPRRAIKPPDRYGDWV